MENANNYYEMSDNALVGLMGQFILETRLTQSKTQQQVADAADIDRSTLVQMENGRGGTVLSFIRVLRVLQLLHIFREFEVKQQASPLLLAKLEQSRRKRVRNHNSKENNTNSTW